MLPTIFGEMRVAADPELRFTSSGKAVGNVRLVSNSRKKDSSGEWVDDKVCWLNGTIWETPAENMVETITAGMLVEVRGRLETREYEDREGNKRTATEIQLDGIAPSIKYATAKVTKVQRTGGQQSSGQAASAPAPEDPWGPPSTQPEEPPF